MSIQPLKVLRITALALVILAWTAAAHLGSISNAPSDVLAALALGPLCLVWALALWNGSHLWWGRMLAVLMLLGVWLFWPYLRTQIAAVYFAQHMGIYLLLAVVFARTLLKQQEPLITQLARRIHGGALSLRQIRYTLRVTQAWALFFLIMALCSTGLFFFASLEAWSTFANLLGAPLLGTMFVLEWLCRHIALPVNERPTMLAAIRAWQAHQARSSP